MPTPATLAELSKLGVENPSSQVLLLAGRVERVCEALVASGQEILTDPADPASDLNQAFFDALERRVLVTYSDRQLLEVALGCEGLLRFDSGASGSLLEVAHQNAESLIARVACAYLGAVEQASSA